MNGRREPVRSPDRAGDAIQTNVTLDDESIEAVARRVVELLRADAAVAPAPLVDATAAAEFLNVSVAYVYRHADELGAVKLTGGKKPRLRFSLDRLASGVCSSERSHAGEDPATTRDSASPRPRQARRNRRNPTERRLTYTPLKEDR